MELCCMWGQLTEGLSCLFLCVNFLTVENIALTCTLFPHCLLTPGGEKGFSVSHCFDPAPGSWERGLKIDMGGHMGPCGGAFDGRVGCNSLLWSCRFWLQCLHTLTRVKSYSSWDTHRGMCTCCLYGGFSRYTLKAKAHTHHIVLIRPSLSSSQAKQALNVWSRTKINVGKQTKQADMGQDEIEMDQREHFFPWTNQREAVWQIFSPSLHFSPLWSSYRLPWW